MMIKLLIGKRIAAIVSTYALQQRLAEDVKDKSSKDLISFVSKVGENELVIHDIHVGKDANGYDGIRGGFVYGVRNLEGERIIEIVSAFDMIVCNTFFKKRDTRLITYTSGPS